MGEAFTNGPGAGKTVGPDGQVETRQWYVNDEKAARRQSQEGAFFHFRHWDDFASVRCECVRACVRGPELVCMFASVSIVVFGDSENCMNDLSC